MPRCEIASFSSSESSAIVRPSAICEHRVVAEAAARRRGSAAITPSQMPSNSVSVPSAATWAMTHVYRSGVPGRDLGDQLGEVLLVGGVRRRRSGRSARPGAQSRASAPMPESSAIAARSVAASGGARLDQRVLGERRRRSPRATGRRRAAAQVDALRRAGARTRAACGRCGWRGSRVAARGGLGGAQRRRCRPRRARAGRRGARARAACARRWPGPRRGRRRRS